MEYLHAEARTWNDNQYGNTYFTVALSLNNAPLITTHIEYGYDRGETKIRELLAENWEAWGLPPFDKRNSPRVTQWAREHEITYTHATTPGRRCDLHHGGK